MIERASTLLDELDGYLSLGAKAECLALARALLKHQTLTVRVFLDATEALLIQADKLKPWRR